jgi:ferredoxin
MNNLYLYFSGTGNTKFVVEKFCELYEESNEDYQIHSIEEKNINFYQLIEKSNTIILAYPIHDSMIPFIMNDFLIENKQAFQDKKLMVIITQLLFSGDGGALPKYLLRKQNIKIIQSIHFKMPNNLTDVPIFPVKTYEESKLDVLKTEKKIEEVVKRIKLGKTYKMGRRIYSWPLGFFTQRGLGKLFVKKFKNSLKIDNNLCSKCQKCIKLCPTDNLYLEDNIVKHKGNCTICYRCVNSCPEKAISIIFKHKPKKQYIRKNFN